MTNYVQRTCKRKFITRLPETQRNGFNLHQTLLSFTFIKNFIRKKKKKTDRKCFRCRENIIVHFRPGIK